jgi:redox-sensitive bicupin YhaK (pirin superfamily)
MMKRYKSCERGHADHGWLDAYHSFSFSQFYNPDRMGVSSLRVINEDRIAPKGGFAPHDHDNMEIITYLLEGSLEHHDSMGNHIVIHAGEVQRMSAGTGITHSEFNPSADEATHLLQIWIKPESQGVEPGYEQGPFSSEGKSGRLLLIASPDGRRNSLSMHQNAFLYASTLQQGERIDHPVDTERTLYLHLIRGAVQSNGEKLESGDGLEMRQQERIEIEGLEDSEILLFDLP